MKVRLFVTSSTLHTTGFLWPTSPVISFDLRHLWIMIYNLWDVDCCVELSLAVLILIVSEFCHSVVLSVSLQLDLTFGYFMLPFELLHLKITLLLHPALASHHFWHVSPVSFQCSLLWRPYPVSWLFVSLKYVGKSSSKSKLSHWGTEASRHSDVALNSTSYSLWLTDHLRKWCLERYIDRIYMTTPIVLA